MHGPDAIGLFNATRDAAKIIVIDLGFLGDTVHLIPALWEIKDHYPRAQLHVLTTPVGRDVLRMVPCVDRVWIFPLGPPSPPWWRHLGLLRNLRHERFDLSFNFGGADRSVLAGAFIRARRSVGYQGARRHFWQPWLIHHWLPRQKLPTPAYEARRKILELCGFTLQPPRFNLSIPEPDRQWAEASIPRGAIHLSLSASQPLKEWPLDHGIRLARQLVDSSHAVVATSAPNPREQARLTELRRQIDSPSLLVIDQPLPVGRLAALLQRCGLHVGPDSGVLHLAAALDIATVAIFRRYPDMADWLPVGARHTCFDAPCPCMEMENPACAPKCEAACLAGISPEMVAKEICRRVPVITPP